MFSRVIMVTFFFVYMTGVAHGADCSLQSPNYTGNGCIFNNQEVISGGVEAIYGGNNYNFQEGLTVTGIGSIARIDNRNNYTFGANASNISLDVSDGGKVYMSGNNYDFDGLVKIFNNIDAAETRVEMESTNYYFGGGISNENTSTTGSSILLIKGNSHKFYDDVDGNSLFTNGSNTTLSGEHYTFFGKISSVNNSELIIHGDNYDFEGGVEQLSHSSLIIISSNHTFGQPSLISNTMDSVFTATVDPIFLLDASTAILIGNNYSFYNGLVKVKNGGTLTIDGNDYLFDSGVVVESDGSLNIKGDTHTFNNTADNYSLYAAASATNIGIQGDDHIFNRKVFVTNYADVTMDGNTYLFDEGLSMSENATMNLKGDNHTFNGIPNTNTSLNIQFNADMDILGNDYIFSHVVYLNNSELHVEGNNYTFNDGLEAIDNSTVSIEGDSHTFNGGGLRSGGVAVHIDNSSSGYITGADNEFNGDLIVIAEPSADNTAADTLLFITGQNNTVNGNISVTGSAAGANAKFIINGLGSSTINGALTADNGGLIDITNTSISDVDVNISSESQLNINNEATALPITFNNFTIVDDSSSIDIRGSATFNDTVIVNNASLSILSGTTHTFNSNVSLDGNSARLVARNVQNMTFDGDLLLTSGAHFNVEGDRYALNGTTTVENASHFTAQSSDMTISNLAADYSSFVYFTTDGLIKIDNTHVAGWMSLRSTTTNPNSNVQINNGYISTLDINDNATTLEVYENLQITNYYSTSGHLIIGTPKQVTNKEYGNVTISRVLLSSNDQVTYVFDLGNLNIDETTNSFDILNIASGTLVENDWDNIQLYIDGILIRNPRSTLEANVELIDGGQKVTIIITRQRETNTDPNLLGANIALYASSIIDQLLAFITDSTLDIGKLDSLITKDQEEHGGRYLSSLYPVSHEMYLLDAYHTSSVLMDTLSASSSLASGSTSMNGSSIFATPILAYTSVEDIGDVTGNSGYKGLIQIGGVIPVPVDGLSILVAGSGGYGRLSSNSEINKHDIKSTTLGILVGLDMVNEYIDGIFSIGYNYNQYDTQRDLTVISTSDRNNGMVAVVDSTDQIVHNMSLGMELGRRLDLASVYVTPSIYYKGGLFMFEEYEETGSIGHLVVDKADSVWVSDFGTKLSLEAEVMTTNVSIVPSGHVGLGYKYYTSENTDSAFVGAEDLEDRLTLDKVEYTGIYLNTGVGIKVYGSDSLSFGTFYTNEVTFGKMSQHGATLSIEYKF